METTESYFMSFESFTSAVKSHVLRDLDVLDHLFESSQYLSHEEKVYHLETLMGEARETVQMISPHLDKSKTFLEIGGGIGLVYGYLLSQGYKVTSIEPSTGGFGDRFHVGQKILESMNIDVSQWLNLKAIDLDPNRHQSDFIFSNMVLEHIPNLKESMERLKHCLSSGGRMVHRCPNYTVPFEPHYNIALVPFFPRWTEYCRPFLKKESLWKDLHFTTVREIKKIACQLELTVSFQDGMYEWVFHRLIKDPTFRERKRFFYKVARWIQIIKLQGVLSLLFKMCPVTFTTPMTFYLERKS